jgi:aminoglycoside 3-N-acetyltransferase
LGFDSLKNVLPRDVVALARRAKKKFKKARVAARPALSEEDFREILAGRLGLAEGDTVFVHSSLDELHLAFPFGRILPLLRSVVGHRGTVLFPTYPGLPSYEFLARGHVFDVRRTPSFMGLLTEYARRQRDAVRSLHPTKSVCALGRLARDLTAEHHLSPYPYDRPSPYYKLLEAGGKVVGLGVSTRALSFVHCVDDALKEEFPVRPYHPELFAARCLDYDGREVTVNTYAHDLARMNHDIPRFMRARVSGAACRDMKIKGAPFYRADAARLFDELARLARDGVTIYPREAYK